MFGGVSLETQERIFDGFIIFTYVFYISTVILGMTIISGEWFYRLDYFVKLYVGLFLIIRYNPFVKTKFTTLDRKLSFHAGVFITMTLLVKTLMIRVMGRDPSFLSKAGLCTDNDTNN